jgi:hypothetical protein
MKAFAKRNVAVCQFSLLFAFYENERRRFGSFLPNPKNAWSITDSGLCEFFTTLEVVNCEHCDI